MPAISPPAVQRDAHLNVYLPEPEAQAVREQAASNSRSISAEVRHAVRAYLDANRAGQRERA